MWMRSTVAMMVLGFVLASGLRATDMELTDKLIAQMGEIRSLSSVRGDRGEITTGDVTRTFRSILDDCATAFNPARCACEQVLNIVEILSLRLPKNQSSGSSGMALPTLFHGQVFVQLIELDNTNTTGGGPFSVNQAQIQLNLPTGANLIYPEGVFQNGRWIIDSGSIEAHATLFVPILIGFDGPGTYQIEAEVSTELFDPDINNNHLSRSVRVLGTGNQLVYPWVSNNAQFESIFVLNNYGTEEALVMLEAIRADGEGRRTQRTIPPRGFLKATAAQLFPSLGEGSGLLVSAISDSTTLGGVWVTNNLTAASGNSPAQGVALVIGDQGGSPGKLSANAGQELVFNFLPTGGETVSAPVLVNLGDQPAAVRLDFFNQIGDLVHSETTVLQALDPLRPFAAVTQSLVPQANEDLYLRTTADQPITGVGFVFNQFGEPSIGNATAAPAADQTQNAHLLLPWVSNNDGFESLVLINNLGDEPAQINLTARRQTGPEATVAHTIPAQGFLRAYANDLFPQLGDGSGYTVEIMGDTPALTANWVTNNLVTPSGSSPSQGVGVDLNQNTATDANATIGQHLLYGFLPLTDGLISGPVVVNVGQAATAVTLRFYDEMGNLLVEDRNSLSSLPPFRPFAAVANNLVGASDGDVYMVASSDGEPLAGVGFAFNASGEPAIGNARPIAFAPPQ